MLLLMFIGGAAQSTAGGVKVNAFAAAVLSLFPDFVIAYPKILRQRV